MKRNINIVCDHNTSQSISGFNPISIENVENLVDCSADAIVYDCIEKIEKSKSKHIFDTLTNKLRPNGVLIIKISDLKSICQNYLLNTISNSQLLQELEPIVNPVNLDEIITYVNINLYKIVNISRKDNKIVISIMRISV